MYPTGNKMINEYTRDALLFLGLVSGTFSTMMLAQQLNQPALYWVSFFSTLIFADFAMAYTIVGITPALVKRARLAKQISQQQDPIYSQ